MAASKKALPSLPEIEKAMNRMGIDVPGKEMRAYEAHPFAHLPTTKKGFTEKDLHEILRKIAGVPSPTQPKPAPKRVKTSFLEKMDRISAELDGEDKLCPSIQGQEVST